MLPATLEALVSECDNIVGLKASNGDLNEITDTARRVARTGRPFSILSGDDSLTIPIMSVGGQGVISVAANLMPVVMANLVHGYIEGRDNTRSAAMMRAIHGLCVALLQVESNPGPVKALMRNAGLPVGPCRLPLFGVTTDQTRHLLSLVDDALAALKDIGAPLDDSLLRLVDGPGGE